MFFLKSLDIGGQFSTSRAVIGNGMLGYLVSHIGLVLVGFRVCRLPAPACVIALVSRRHSFPFPRSWNGMITLQQVLPKLPQRSRRTFLFSPQVVA
ncbi:hypothetical protein IMZ48_42095 [Candidatus Bathyarchaeota archaeon]|nr:hypothetical protein [Candidatus Bathyarchaeota archaeon]